MIYYRNAVRRSGVNGRAVVATAKKLLAAVGKPGASLSVMLVDDEAIRSLNRRFRNKNKPTDVLSFAITQNETAMPEPLLGDVVISVETARRQAAEYDATIEQELYRLLIHGLLHVLGHDHQRVRERERMQNQERRLAEAIGLPWPYAET